MSTTTLRSAEDATALIGMGATDIFGRIPTSLHGIDAFLPAFTACRDIPAGGVLLALPVFLAMGLLQVLEDEVVPRLEAEIPAQPKHITVADLPEEDRFRRLGTKSIYLIDTIKMIAY